MNQLKSADVKAIVQFTSPISHVNVRRTKVRKSLTTILLTTSQPCGGPVELVITKKTPHTWVCIHVETSGSESELDISTCATTSDLVRTSGFACADISQYFKDAKLFWLKRKVLKLLCCTSTRILKSLLVLTTATRYVPVLDYCIKYSILGARWGYDPFLHPSRRKRPEPYSNYGNVQRGDDCPQF